MTPAAIFTNHVLAQQPWAREALARHAGRSLRIAAPPFALGLAGLGAVAGLCGSGARSTTGLLVIKPWQPASSSGASAQQARTRRAAAPRALNRSGLRVMSAPACGAPARTSGSRAR